MSIVTSERRSQPEVDSAGEASVSARIDVAGAMHRRDGCHLGVGRVVDDENVKLPVQRGQRLGEERGVTECHNDDPHSRVTHVPASTAVAAGVVVLTGSGRADSGAGRKRSMSAIPMSNQPRIGVPRTQ